MMPLAHLMLSGLVSLQPFANFAALAGTGLHYMACARRFRLEVESRVEVFDPVEPSIPAKMIRALALNCRALRRSGCRQ
jgi:hypothetical protein